MENKIKNTFKIFAAIVESIAVVFLLSSVAVAGMTLLAVAGMLLLPLMFIVIEVLSVKNFVKGIK